MELGRGLFYRPGQEGQPGELLDLRNVLAMVGQVGNWIDVNLRIPIVPYMFQFNPARLLPWMPRAEPNLAALTVAGEVQPFLTGIAAAGQEQTVRLVLGYNPARLWNVRLNLDQPGTLAQLERVPGEFVRAQERSGFWQVISESFLQPSRYHRALIGAVHGEPWPEGILSGLRAQVPFLNRVMTALDLGDQTEPSLWQRIRSVWSKFGDPRYGPTAWNELITRDLGPAEAEQRLASLQRFLGARGQVGPQLERWLGLDPTEPGARMQFVERLAAEASQPTSGFLNPQFREVWHEYRTNPEAFLGGTWRSEYDELFSIPLISPEHLETRIDYLYRQAVREQILRHLADAEASGTRTEALQQLLARLGDSPEELAFVGHLLLRQARGQAPYLFGAGRLQQALRGQLTATGGLAEAVQALWPNLETGLADLEQLGPHLARAVPRLARRFELGPVGGFAEEEGLEVLGRRYLFVPRGQGLLRAINDAVRGKDSLRQGLGRWLRQFNPFLGRGQVGQSDDFTAATFIPYYMLYRLNRMANIYGLGLGYESMGSTAQLAASLIFRRAVPILVGGFYAGYLGWELEQTTGLDPGDAYAEGRKWASLGLAELRDITGVTDLLKWAWPLMPGLENYWTPRSADELEEYYERGYDPVRQGRWWLLSPTPWYGGRIAGWVPNWYRLKKADLEYVKLGGAENIYAHSWLPTPTHPFSPLMALWDPYWKEKALAAQGQVFPVSGPMFEETFPGGELLNLTVGRLLKPERGVETWGRRYLRRFDRYQRGRAVLDPSGPASDVASYPLEGPIRPLQAAPQTGLIRPIAGPSVLFRGLIQLGQPGLVSVGPGPLAHGVGRTDVGVSPTDEPGYLYVTPSGRIQPAQATTGEPVGGALAQRELADLNQAARERAVLYHQLLPARQLDQLVSDPLQGLAPPDGTISPQAARLQLARTLYSAQELMGLYGWASSILTDEPFVRQPTLQPASRGYDLESRFWGREMGGSFTGSLLLSPLEESLSELVRRFLPHRRRLQPEWNEVPNWLMPSWLPNARSGYFENLQTGAPMTKVGPFGFARVPGPGYEAVWGKVEPQFRTIPPALFGYPFQAQLAFVLGRWEPPELAQDLIQGGQLQIVQTEQGFEPVRYRAVSEEQLARLNRPLPADVSELNAYLAALELPYGILEYHAANASGQLRRFRVELDRERLQREWHQAKRAEQLARKLVRTGRVNKWEVVSDLDKVRILSNIAPWSAEYRYYLGRVTADPNLPDEVREELAEIRERVHLQKQREDIHPYIFRRGRLNWERVQVESILAPGVFKVVEYEQPIRFAGLRVVTAEAQRETVLARMEALGIRPGARVWIAREQEPSEDIYGSYHAAVRGPFWTNIGLALYRAGLATPMGRADTAVEVYNRYGWLARRFGATWERVFHSQIPLISNKLLPLRSGLEQYQRAHFYGASDTDWAAPWSGWVRPMLRSWAASGPISAGLKAAFVLGAFTPYSTARLVRDLWSARHQGLAAIGRRLWGAPWHGAKLGFVLGAGLSLVRSGYEFLTGRPWIPGQRQREWELLQYWDILTYLKWRGIYNELSRRAKREEGIDIERLVGSYHSLGRQVQSRIRQLQAQRRKLMRAGNPDPDRLDRIRQELAELHNFRNLKAVGPITLMALQARARMERTLYGVDPADYQNVIAALPRHMRPSIEATIQYGTEREKRQLYRILPPFVQRAVAPWLGQRADRSSRQPNLVRYFEQHFLPPAHWPGWQPSYDLEWVKVESLSRSRVSLREVGYWENQLLESELARAVPVPKWHVPTRGSVRRQLGQVIRGEGVREVRLISESVPGRGRDLQVVVDLSESWQDDPDFGYQVEHEAQILARGR